jgi:Zn-dependent protease
MTSLLNFNPLEMLARLLIVFVALPFHEFAHAWTANYFGDDTPRANGRLTLNPLAHLDLIGTAMLVLMGFGWAKPVPINPYALRRHSASAAMWVALAGPLSNFILALLGVIPFRLGLAPMGAEYGTLAYLLIMLGKYFVLINLMLALFNLLPIPPLDGSYILSYLLPARMQHWMDMLRSYGSMLMIVLFMFGGLLISQPVFLLYSLLMP